MLWNRALGKSSRQEIDAKNSHESIERDEDLDAYEGLAVIYNNNEAETGFHPQNKACLYEKNKIKMPVEPFSELIDIKVAMQLSDLNPTEEIIVHRLVKYIIFITLCILYCKHN